MEDKKFKYKNSDNAAQFAKSYEVNNMPSLTVPDQSISPQEMLARHQKGLPISGKRVTFYDDDGTSEELAMPDLSKLDLSEIHDMMEANRAHIKALREKLDAAKLAENEQRQYAKWREQHEKEMAKIKSDSQPPAGSDTGKKEVDL